MVLKKVFSTELTLRAVNVNWNDDGWNVNANEVSNPNAWNDGNQVFSRNYCFSPIIFLVGVLFPVLFSNRQADDRFLPIFEKVQYTVLLKLTCFPKQAE
jgi:hypothetical protein